jgi:hypothetical protein
MKTAISIEKTIARMNKPAVNAKLVITSRVSGPDLLSDIGVASGCKSWSKWGDDR